MLDIRSEIEFWTLILRDHAEFQLVHFASNETEYIKNSEYFKKLFNDLNEEVSHIDGDIPEPVLIQLISKNKTAVNQFVKYKKDLLKSLIKYQVKLSMSPTFLNHMINEALEYYRVLNIAEESLRLNNTLENIRLHKVWLPDAAGHAKSISSNLDGVESNYIKIADDFSKKFDKLFKKAYEMYSMYERTGIHDSQLYHVNKEVILLMEDFIDYLEDLEKLRMEIKIFACGTFDSLMLNHMIREERYYLYKIRSFE